MCKYSNRICQSVLLCLFYFISETMEWFSAECAFFGEMMSDAFSGRPIGLIAFAWTNTPLQSWLSAKVRNKCQTPKP